MTKRQVVRYKKDRDCHTGNRGNGRCFGDGPRVFNGLGLAIIKELVSAHKGKIKAESTHGADVTFTITFRKAL